ncbi:MULTISPECIES: bifunctional hydroxymethylpyrimidine kinase/phosphomethylpyrimidine kinase [Olivibacter]|uniref:hydroxymethylpyrimidine kinase n=1 Tax=Olivibacter oleidegradans TaxID=760123 RepID=A0ABV6HNA8_9SPHI|nr:MULTISPECIES: bifunctional hydroxymethylpyrimidine kinase/phosphomethylpyrimidine kinase [Olivibacter]MDM8173311.1 bifunctional hydroxymethylpyrimidine kinase/phosphomethylpyrimidine kinase [Olivibacter sp. 47]QEL03090.1 bifunctional hydroxymethylpyrimidine kinase/phosphomethylpyrimidine kinase [Olivibacter sp. LS-1]
MQKEYIYPIAMTIAGFDGSGGAGIQADIKTFSALGCFATSVLTALPIQNTQGVQAIYAIPDRAIQEQIRVLLSDIFPKAIKIGMVHTATLVDVIVETLSEYPKVPLIFDPVMVASSGHRLVQDATVATIVEKLIPKTDLITPNIDEAAVLAEMKISSLDDMYIAGERILKLGATNVLLKGGHLQSSTLTSLYFDNQGKVHSYESAKLETNNLHGTGCTLSSAITSFLARDFPMESAIVAGQCYTYKAIKNGMDVLTGKGRGPLNHFFDPEKLIKNAFLSESEQDQKNR